MCGARGDVEGREAGELAGKVRAGRCVGTYHDRAIGLLADGDHRKGRGASTAGVHCDDDVIRVVPVVVLHLVAVDDHARTLEQRVDVGRVEGLVRRVGAHAHALAEQHGGVFGKQTLDDFPANTALVSVTSPGWKYLVGTNIFADDNHLGISASL